MIIASPLGLITYPEHERHGSAFPAYIHRSSKRVSFGFEYQEGDFAGKKQPLDDISKNTKILFVITVSRMRKRIIHDLRHQMSKRLSSGWNMCAERLFKMLRTLNKVLSCSVHNHILVLLVHIKI
jgi:hypothetical protein